ncbi:hypothetical protein, partial [Klebsiella pneumoniae]|uniref:hypothetical protein n=1 Tax=Klebsiella pneumoniae TaxID=573 RepID=UPI003075CBB8
AWNTWDQSWNTHRGILKANIFVNYLYSCLLILTPVFRGGFLYIFHVYLEEWHSDVSRHWPLSQAVASTACERQKKI